MDVISAKLDNPQSAIDDIKSVETAVRSSIESETAFRKPLAAMVERQVKRAENAGNTELFQPKMSTIKGIFFSMQ